MLRALFFDCDGVLADTERDGHRAAFNKAFQAKGIDVVWSVDRYEELLGTAGGKERMRRHFDETEWPVPEDERDALIVELHESKSKYFRELVEQGQLPVRPGIERLIDAAIASDVRLAVCSTSARSSVQAIVDSMGAARAGKITLFCGDVVPRKKPDPGIYLLAAETLGVDPAECVVVEDSSIGLRAAVAAGMACVVTLSTYTVNEDFTGAARVVSELGDGPNVKVTLQDCRDVLTDRTAFSGKS